MQASSSAHSQGSRQPGADPARGQGAKAAASVPASSQGAGQDSVLGKRKGAPGNPRPALQAGTHPHAAQTAADLMRIWNSARESRAATGSHKPSGHKHGAGADVYPPASEQESESTASVPKRQRRGSGGEQARAAADGCPKVARQEHSVPGQASPGAAGPLRPRRARTAAAMAASEAQRRRSAAASAPAAAAGGAGRPAPADRLQRREQPAQVRLRRAALSLDF